MSLHFISIEESWEEVDILSGAHKTAEHTALNPFQTVPTLEHNGLVLFESPPILEYLAELLGIHGEYGIPKEINAKYKTINMLHKYHNLIVPGQRNVSVPVFDTLWRGKLFDVEAFTAGLVKTKADQWKQLEDILVRMLLVQPQQLLISIIGWIYIK